MNEDDQHVDLNIVANNKDEVFINVSCLQVLPTPKCLSQAY